MLAMAAALVGAAIKFSVGLWASSLALLTSAADSLGDMLVSAVNFAVVRLAERPPDDDHNYGHAKVEGLGAMFEGGFIFAAGSFVIYESAQSLRHPTAAPDTALALWAMAPVLLLTGVTVWNMRRVAAATGSVVLRADALHYATDIYMNLGVLVALIAVRLTGFATLDAIIAIGLALYMLYASWGIVREGFDIVMDKSLPADVAERVQQQIATHAEIISVHDFKTRAGKIPHVDFHIVVAPVMSVAELHALFLRLREEIRGLVGAQTKVMMHADPQNAPAHADDGAIS